MTEPTELLPCPFCGNQPEPTGYYAVICMGCGVSGPSAGGFEAASALWNTRAQQPTQAQAGAVPLTKEQRSRIVLTADTVSEAIDMVERHYGIKGGQHGL